MEKPKPSYSEDDLYVALQDAIVIGLRGDNAEKFVKIALEFLQYRHYKPDTPAGTPDSAKKELADLMGRVDKAMEDGE